MEKRKKERTADWSGMLRSSLKGLAAAAGTFIVGLFAVSALISHGIVPAAQLPAALCAVYALEAFGATTLIALLQRRQVFAAGLLTQGMLFALLLLVGMLLYESRANWLQLAAALLAALLATAAAAALWKGKGKKKGNNFKKNSHRRLKKK